MNNLSLLIYLAEVSDRVSGVFGFLSFIIGSGVILSVIGLVASMVEPRASDAMSVRKASKIGLFLLTPIFFLFMSLSALLPSKEVIYMIAASEAGEYVLDRPETSKYINDLREILDKKIEELK